MGTIVAAIIGAVATLLAVWLRYSFEEKRRAETRRREPAKHEAAQALRLGFEMSGLHTATEMDDLSDDGSWVSPLYRSRATNFLERIVSRVKTVAASIPIDLPKGLSPANLGKLDLDHWCREVRLQFDAKPAKVRLAYDMGASIGSIQILVFVILRFWRGDASEDMVQKMQDCRHRAVEISRELMASRKMVKQLKKITYRTPRAILQGQPALGDATKEVTLEKMLIPMSNMYAELEELVDALALELES